MDFCVVIAVVVEHYVFLVTSGAHDIKTGSEIIPPHENSDENDIFHLQRVTMFQVQISPHKNTVR